MPRKSRKRRKSKGSKRRSSARRSLQRRRTKGSARRSKARRSKARRSSRRRKSKGSKKQDIEVRVMAKELNITKNHCRGFVTKNKGVEFNNPQLGDFNELFCVIAGYKPIASMEIGDDYLSTLRPHRNIINKIIDLARKNDIYAIIHTYSAFRLLMAYPKKNEDLAILTQYTYVTDRGRQLKTDYLSGKLLGYSEENIKHFYSKNIKNGASQYKLDKKNFKSLVKLIKNCEEYQYFHSLSKGKAIKFPHI